MINQLSSMTGTKKIIIGMAALLVIAGGLVLYKVTHKTVPNTPITIKPGKENFDPKNPNYILGNITSVSPSEIKFKSGGQEYTAKLNSSTVFVKQSIDKNGLVRLVSATLPDFKINKPVIIYFEAPQQDNVYNEVSKVQVID